MLIKRAIAIFLLLLIPVQAFCVDTLYIKKNDLQPFYYAQVKDPNNTVIDITGATIYVTMKLISTGTVKINRQTTGVNITDGTNGKFEYRWQSTDTNTIGQYSIEFEINPLSGGKYTVPAYKNAIVSIQDSLDSL